MLDKKVLIRDAFFYALAIGLIFRSFQNGGISVFEASIFLLVYVVYILFLRQTSNRSYHGNDALEEMEEEVIREEQEVEKRFFLLKGVDRIIDMSFPSPSRKGRYRITFAVAIIWIAVLSRLLVESGVSLAADLGISEVII